MTDELTAAYDHCRVLTRREARNFYYGFMLLPGDQRRAIHAAYAFARDVVELEEPQLPGQDAGGEVWEYDETHV